MEKIFARIVLVFFHPLLITVLGVLILFKTNLYITFLSAQMRQVVILSTFLFTCLLPLVLIFLFRLLKKQIYGKGSYPEVTITYMLIAFSYYVGYYYISKLPLAGFFKTGFLAGTLLIVSLSLISLRWNISSHTAGVGAMAGLSVAIMLRLGVYDPLILFGVMMAGGLTGFSMLALEKNTPAQVYAGYFLGFGILFLVFTYI